MKNKQYIEKGEILEGGISTAFWKEVSGFINREINRVSEAIIKGDFDELKELYFLKGQLIGLAKASSYPKKTIKRKNELEIAAKLKEEKKKKKQKGK